MEEKLIRNLISLRKAGEIYLLTIFKCVSVLSYRLYDKTKIEFSRRETVRSHFFLVTRETYFCTKWLNIVTEFSSKGWVWIPESVLLWIRLRSIIKPRDIFPSHFPLSYSPFFLHLRLGFMTLLRPGPEKSGPSELHTPLNARVFSGTLIGCARFGEDEHLKVYGMSSLPSL